MACNKFSAYFLPSRMNASRVSELRTRCTAMQPRHFPPSKANLLQAGTQTSDTSLDPGPEGIILLAKIKSNPRRAN